MCILLVTAGRQVHDVRAILIAGIADTVAVSIGLGGIRYIGAVVGGGFNAVFVAIIVEALYIFCAGSRTRPSAAAGAGPGAG